MFQIVITGGLRDCHDLQRHLISVRPETGPRYRGSEIAGQSAAPPQDGKGRLGNQAAFFL
jgi:hypothetical protein